MDREKWRGTRDGWEWLSTSHAIFPWLLVSIGSAIGSAILAPDAGNIETAVRAGIGLLVGAFGFVGGVVLVFVIAVVPRRQRDEARASLAYATGTDAVVLRAVTTGFVVLVEVENQGEARTFEALIESIDGITPAFEMDHAGGYRAAWIDAHQSMGKDLTGLGNRRILSGGRATFGLISFWGWGKNADDEPLFHLWPATARGEFAAHPSAPSVDAYRVTGRVVWDDGWKAFTYIVRGGRGRRALWVEDEDGNRLSGQPSPEQAVEIVENMACLRLTNRGLRDSFRVKVSDVTGTGAQERDYELQWMDFPDARELTLDRDESALLRIAALNVMDTSVDADRWLELGLSRHHLLRLFKRSGHVDREVPDDVDVRLRMSVYRGRSDAAPIGSSYRIAIASNAVSLERDDATPQSSPDRSAGQP